MASAAPHSSFELTTWSATSFREGVALSTATPIPARLTISRSLSPSPTARTSSALMPYCLNSLFNPEALLVPSGTSSSISGIALVSLAPSGRFRSQ